MSNKIIGTALTGFWIAVFIGWVMNIYKLTECDFDVPLKSEVFRCIGIPLFPLGAVIGYMDIKDGRTK
jgi:hypothetical protein